MNFELILRMAMPPFLRRDRMFGFVKALNLGMLTELYGLLQDFQTAANNQVTIFLFETEWITKQVVYDMPNTCIREVKGNACSLQQDTFLYDCRSFVSPSYDYEFPVPGERNFEFDIEVDWPTANTIEVVVDDSFQSTKESNVIRFVRDYKPAGRIANITFYPY
jgi:hypothetical protein